MTRPSTHAASSERGIALLLSLFLVLAVSIITSSIMYLGQGETYSGNNYRLMSQTRYAAESGVQAAANYLLYTYTKPTPGGADDLASYTYVGTSPVTWNGKAVVLSANGAVASNYPVASVQAAFAAAAGGTLTTGPTSVTYGPYATLMSMEQVNSYGGGTALIQTWQIVSDGTVNTGGKSAQEEVSAVLETQVVPVQMYAAFGTSGGCGALQFAGGANTNSYNSAALNGGMPVFSQSGGNVGTNGNLTQSGGATINGTLSTPRVGVGNCSNGNVDALTSKGGATVTGGVVQLPQAWSPTSPTITMPSPAPPNSAVSIGSGTTCASLGLSAPTCTGTAGNLTLNAESGPLTLGNVSVSSGATLTLDGALADANSTGIYNINSLSIEGGGVVSIASGGVTTTVVNSVSVTGGGSIVVPTDKSANMTMDIVNTTGVNTPVSLAGGAIANGSYDPALFQLQYAGTGNFQVTGGAEFAAVIFAPNAAMQLSGGGDIYGSMVMNTLVDTGGAQIHYDTSLSTSFVQAGNPMLEAFSWKKY